MASVLAASAAAGPVRPQAASRMAPARTVAGALVVLFLRCGTPCAAAEAAASLPAATVLLRGGRQPRLATALPSASGSAPRKLTAVKHKESQQSRCDQDCEFEGILAACGGRMEWAQTHMFSEYINACEMAHDLVTTQCDVCAGCTLEALGCDGGPDVVTDKHSDLEHRLEHRLEHHGLKKRDDDEDTIPLRMRNRDPLEEEEDEEDYMDYEEDIDVGDLDLEDGQEDDVSPPLVPDTAITEINWQAFGGDEDEIADLTAREKDLFGNDGEVDDAATEAAKIEEEFERQAAMAEEQSQKRKEDEFADTAGIDDLFGDDKQDETKTHTQTSTATSTTRTTVTSTRTSTATPTTATATTTTSSTRTQTLKPAPMVYNDDDFSVDENLGCDSMCIYQDRYATCTNRVLWGARREFAGDTHGCDLAYGLVLEQCPVCSLCLLEHTGCTKARTPSAGLPYECNVGLATWQDSWDSAKIEWCCKNHGLGCSSDEGQGMQSGYNCSTPTSKWTAIQSRWCCAHKNVGCGVKKYNCNTESVDWESWSHDQKVWCHKHTDFSKLHTCPVDEADWETLWRDRRKAWCCQYGTKWIEGKKDWCCQREGIGCDRLYRNELNLKDEVKHSKASQPLNWMAFLAVVASGAAIGCIMPRVVRGHTKTGDSSCQKKTATKIAVELAPSVRPETITLLQRDPPLLPDSQPDISQREFRRDMQETSGRPDRPT